jgi:Mrp family chromosome partitioning ATPase
MEEKNKMAKKAPTLNTSIPKTPTRPVDLPFEEQATMNLAAVPSSLFETPASQPVHQTKMPTPPPMPVRQTKMPAPQSASATKKVALPSTKQLAEIKMVTLLQERCRQLGLTIFFGVDTKVQSLGLTSSIAGEGKSFLTIMMANILARDISNPITLLECNWEHPCFHEHFGIHPTPGLAEWLRGECDERSIRYQVNPNLTVIPAGNSRQDSVRLLQYMRKNHALDNFLHSDGLLIVDLPPVVTTAYGSLAASLVDSLVLVIHAGVTTELLVTETCTQLKDLPIYGVILNQMESRIPRWLRRLL